MATDVMKHSLEGAYMQLLFVHSHQGDTSELEAQLKQLKIDMEKVPESRMSLMPHEGFLRNILQCLDRDAHLVGSGLNEPITPIFATPGPPPTVKSTRSSTGTPSDILDN